MYISYEDVNIYQGLYGVEKAKEYVSYDNLYQYDETYMGYYIESNESTIYLGDTFTKKTSEKEFITRCCITCT